MKEEYIGDLNPKYIPITDKLVSTVKMVCYSKAQFLRLVKMTK